MDVGEVFYVMWVLEIWGAKKKRKKRIEPLQVNQHCIHRSS